MMKGISAFVVLAAAPWVQSARIDVREHTSQPTKWEQMQDQSARASIENVSSECDQSCTFQNTMHSCREIVSYVMQGSWYYKGESLGDVLPQVNHDCAGQCMCTSADFIDKVSADTKPGAVNAGSAELFSCQSTGPPPKGVCLFDVDGTISTTKHVDAVLDECLKRGFAVGIATAGGYTISKLCPVDRPEHFPYRWMTLKFCENIEQCKTFNAVGSNKFLMNDQLNASARYQEGLKGRPSNASGPGWRKGFALHTAVQDLKVEEPCGILFDDDPKYLSGAQAYIEAHSLPFATACAKARKCGGADVPDSLTPSYVGDAVDRSIRLCT